MADGKLLLYIVGTIALLIFLASILLPALKEGGHLKAPRIGRKSRPSSFRQFPLHPPVQGDDSDIEIY